MSTPRRNVRRSLFTNAPAAKRAKPSSVNALVRKAVLRNAETKKKEFNGVLYQGGLAGVLCATFPLTGISQGTDDGERIGNKILVTGVDIQLTGVLSGPVRIILYSPKDVSAAMTPPSFQIDSLLDLDSVNIYHDWIYAQGNDRAVINYKNRRQFHTEYFGPALNQYSVRPLYCCIAPNGNTTTSNIVKGTIRMWYKDM